MSKAQEILDLMVEEHMAIQAVLQAVTDGRQPTEAEYDRLAKAFTNVALWLKNNTKPEEPI